MIMVTLLMISFRMIIRSSIHPNTQQDTAAKQPAAFTSSIRLCVCISGKIKIQFHFFDCDSGQTEPLNVQKYIYVCTVR